MSESHRIPKGVRSLLRKADAGDIKALYQMARYFREGRYIEQDNEKADKYIVEIATQIDQAKFKVDNLKIVNFRGFRELSLDFDPRLTIFVGANGAGKSAILDSLSMSLSWFGANVRKEDRTAVSIKEEDISTGSDFHYASIISTISLSEDDRFRIMLSKIKEGAIEKRDSELTEIKSLAGMYRYANEFFESFNLPLVAHYTVFRSVGGSKSEMINAQKKFKDSKWSKLSAYDHALKEQHDFSGFLAWLIRVDSAARQSSGAESDEKLLELRSEVNSIKSIISHLSKSSHGETVSLESVENLLEEKVSQLSELEAKSHFKEKSFHEKAVSLVFEAIGYFMTGLTGFHLDYTGEYIDLKMYKDESLISVLHLSQGERSLMALVGDIARRLVMLNPGRENPLEGQGIIMIDEVDLHLHPGWQQKVVSRLQTTFPNLQLILTTHSPQVLTTVKKENIRIFDREKGVAYIPQAVSYGEESQDVLHAIMGVNPQPPIPELEKLQRLTELVDIGRYESTEAIALLEELEFTLSKP